MPARAAVFVWLAATTAAALASAPGAPADGPIRNPAGVKGYAVHEWGVFTIHPDLEMANAALAAEWADCPKELYRTEPPNLRNLPWRGGVDKPIVYFHWDGEQPPPEQGVRMTVRFPDGRPVIWWPASEEGAGLKPAGQEVTDSLSWRLFLRKQPGGPAGAPPRTPQVADDHWYAQARKVKAEPVFSYGGHGRGGTTRTDAEQFVYYDGLMKPLAFLKARRTPAGAIVLDTTAPYPIHDLWCIDRTGPEPKLARVPLVPPGKKTIDLDWKTVAADDWHAATAEALAAELEKTGLHADEARSLAAIWQPGFFHAPGLTLFYRLPQREYDRVTTIALDPVPETLVRVGIMHHAHAEPEREKGDSHQLPVAEGDTAPAIGRGLRTIGDCHLFPPTMKPLQLEKRLTAAEATKLAAANHDLCLFGLSKLTPDVLDALAAHQKRLTIVGLDEPLDREAASALARHAGPVDVPQLDVTRLVDAEHAELGRKLFADVVGASAAIAAIAELPPVLAIAIELSPFWNGHLPAVKTLTPAVAEALALSPKWDGQLPAVTAFEAAESVAVAKALATRKGPLALPNLKKISPKTLTALVEKQDIDIPRVETLELIAEPDGSATEDFVIPKWLEERQQRLRQP
jgi:hypothetical protein